MSAYSRSATARVCGHPDEVVTNAHVVREILQDDTLRIGIVPPEGDGADYAKIISVRANDLALVEVVGALRLPPLTLTGTSRTTGDEVAAVGYPMNVDRAQGLGRAIRSTPNHR